MNALLIFACLSGHLPDECYWAFGLVGFANEAQCQEMGEKIIVPWWLKLHPPSRLERWVCTEHPQFFLTMHKDGQDS